MSDRDKNILLTDQKTGTSGAVNADALSIRLPSARRGPTSLPNDAGNIFMTVKWTWNCKLYSRGLETPLCMPTELVVDASRLWISSRTRAKG